jgi:two-component system nitrate/nitrite response regulator NarL
VVVGDDHPTYREGVARGLSSSGRVIVVAEAGDGRAAVAAIREHRPDVAVIDYRLPGLDGLSGGARGDARRASHTRADPLGIH